jgi:sulfane dehydrogenase subunit SoxC
LIAVDSCRRYDPGGMTTDGITFDELGLAARNHGFPLEALQWDLTPVGLHYLLIHYDIPAVDPLTWRLEVDGAVDRPISIDLGTLYEGPLQTRTLTMECAGNGRALLEPRPISQPWLLHAVGNAAWTGVPLSWLLEKAGVQSTAKEVLFTGLDRGIDGGIEQNYQRSLPLDEIEDVIVAIEMNGQPLTPQHGAPARLLVPGWYGMTHVKWLSKITLVTEPFDGFQQTQAYQFRQNDGEAGRPVTRMLPRSLLQPPGIPDFMTRRRLMEAGRVELSGRAWSGFGPIVGVEVSVNGGATWQDASVEPTTDRYSWHRWTFPWEANVGTHDLCCRATDSTGRTQPLEPIWNTGGYEVNAVQHVAVEVR